MLPSSHKTHSNLEGPGLMKELRFLGLLESPRKTSVPVAVERLIVLECSSPFDESSSS
jgi:hypothetical protein